MANTSFDGGIIVPDDIRLGGKITPGLDRDEVLAVAELQPFTVPWTLWRVWNAVTTNLPASSGDDDLSLVGGTWTTDVPSIQTEDFGGASSVQYARAQIQLPWDYLTGQTVKLRFHAGALTTLPDTTCDLDVICYKSDEESLVDAGDICATAAQSIKSLTFADIDFTITPTTLAPGDLLDVRVSITYVDAGDLGTMVGCIGAVQLLCDVR